MKRIYLDFDGVVAPVRPKVEREEDWVAVNMPITGRELVHKEVLDFLRSTKAEIVWISHRDSEDLQRFTEIVGLPTYRHLTFNDPTGSKVQAIWDDLRANSLEDAEDAVVIDDELTEEEIQDLTIMVPVYVPNGDYGLDIEHFKLTVLGD